MPSNSSTLDVPAVFTADDRCDASQAEQATAMFVKVGHTSLIFCEHHARKYGADLMAEGWVEATT
jgi:hypothetical protein